MSQQKPPESPASPPPPPAARPFWHVNRPLITLKLLLISFYGGMICLLPLLTVHLKSLGASPAEAAVIQGTLPFIRSAGPIVAGMLADRIGNYRLVLAMLLVLSCIFHTLLLWVPPYGSYKVTYSYEPVDLDGYLHWNLTTTKTPHALLYGNDHNVIRFDKKIDFVFTNSNEEKNDNDSDDIEPYVTCDITPQQSWWSSSEIEKFVKCSKYTEQSICRTSSAEHANNSAACIEQQQFYHQESSSFVANLGDIFNGRYRVMEKSSSQSSSNAASTTVIGQCLLPHALVEQQNNNTFFNISSCSEIIHIGNRWQTLGMYFLIRTFCTILMGADFGLIDATAFAMPREHGGDFGWNKLFGVVATCAFAPLSGLLVDWSNTKNNNSSLSSRTDYSWAFYSFDIMMLVTAAVALFGLNLSIRTPRKQVVRGVSKLLCRPKILIFIVAVCMLGMCWGFIDAFLLWFLKDLGASTLFQQSTQTVGSLAGIPATAFSTLIIRYCGHVNILIAAIIAYGIRMLGVSFLTAATYGYVMFFEAMEALTTHLVWITVIVYCSVLAPELVASLQGITNGLHFGSAKGIGTFVGGTMYSALGAQTSYRIFGMTTIAAGSVYAVMYYLCVKCCLKSEDDEQKNDDEAAKDAERNTPKNAQDEDAEIKQAMLTANSNGDDAESSAPPLAVVVSEAAVIAAGADNMQTIEPFDASAAIATTSVAAVADDNTDIDK